MDLMKSYKKTNKDMSYSDMVNDYNTSYQRFGNGGKVEFNSGGETHIVYKKESPTGNGKGVEGHIMVNHPTKDKGKWDTIDLTAITNYDVKTVQEGIASTKQWHKENPEYAYGGMHQFDNGGKMPKKEINLNIKNQEFNSPVSTWNENLDWQGEKYNDVGLNFNKKNLNIGIGNYVPRSTFEKVGNVNPYLNVSYDLNDRNSIGGNFSKDYNGVSFIRKFDNGGKLSYPQKIQAYNDSTILFNSGFGRGIPNQIYNPQFNAAKKRLTELNKEEPQSTDYYRSYKNNPEYIKTHSIPYAKPTYPKKDTVLPEKKEKTRTDIYTNKDLFDKAYKAETDSSNAYTHYKNDTKGWVPANTVKNENKVKDFVKNNQTLKDAYYNKTEDAITYFPTKPKKPVVHNVYQPPPPPEKMIPIEARIPKDIVEPGLKTSPKDFGYRRIGWRNDPNTHLQVPVLLTHPKMKVKQGERIYNKEIPTSTMGIPKDWEAEFSKPETFKDKHQYGGIQRFEDGGEFDDEGSIIKNKLNKNTLAKDERSNQDNTRVFNLPIKTLQALQQQADVERASRQQYKQQPVISQGKKLTPTEQAYSDKVQARIANPSNDLGITAANMASALTRFRYLNPEEIAATTNNPMGTVGLSSGIMTEALANEMVGPAFGKALTSGTKVIKKVPKELPSFSNVDFSVNNIGKSIKQSSNKIDQSIIDNYTQREIDWLNSDEYIKRNINATGKSKEAVIKERNKIFDQINKTTLNVLDDKADMAAGVYTQDKKNPLINLFNTGNEAQLFNVADHEIKHAVSQQAIRNTDGLIDLVTNPYKKYPTVNVKKWYDNFIPGETTSKWASNAPEQQVVSKRIMDLVEKTQGVKRGTQLTEDNIKGVTDLLNKEIKNKNPQNSDIIAMLSSFKSKFGKNYYSIIKDMVNKAYIVPAVIGASTLQKIDK